MFSSLSNAIRGATAIPEAETVRGEANELPLSKSVDLAKKILDVSCCTSASAQAT
jgi:hypothetical protein